MTAFVWYTVDEKLKAVRHPAAALDEALAAARKIYADAAGSPVNPATAETRNVFGLMQDRDTYLEFLMYAADSILWQLAVPRSPGAKRGFFARFLAGDRYRKGTLKSWAEIEARIRTWYDAGPYFMWEETDRDATGARGA
jgi:hypothetical protein